MNKTKSKKMSLAERQEIDRQVAVQHVHSKEFTQEYLAQASSTNTMLAQAGVNIYVRAHYINPEKGIEGVTDLILYFLHSTQRIVDTSDLDLAGNPEHRDYVITNSFYLSEIEYFVHKEFRDANRPELVTRYPLESIRAFLCQQMPEIVSIQLSTQEDSNRPSNLKKPRAKYALLQDYVLSVLNRLLARRNGEQS